MQTSHEALRLQSLEEASRRDTVAKHHVRYLNQVPLGAPIGTQRWVRHALTIRVAESSKDRHLAAVIIRERHYLTRWVARPMTKIIHYLADLAGCSPGEAGCAGLITVTLQPARYHAAIALGIQQCSTLSLSRAWRSDDLTPDIAPNFSPEFLRRVIRGERNRGPLRPMADEWAARKLTGGLHAPARLLATYADPQVGHDGAVYVAAGGIDCGLAGTGKRLFCWALDPAIADDLKNYAAARRDLDRERNQSK